MDPAGTPPRLPTTLAAQPGPGANASPSGELRPAHAALAGRLHILEHDPFPAFLAARHHDDTSRAE